MEIDQIQATQLESADALPTEEGEDLEKIKRRKLGPAEDRTMSEIEEQNNNDGEEELIITDHEIQNIVDTCKKCNLTEIPPPHIPIIWRVLHGDTQLILQNLGTP